MERTADAEPVDRTEPVDRIEQTGGRLAGPETADLKRLQPRPVDRSVSVTAAECKKGPNDRRCATDIGADRGRVSWTGSLEDGRWCRSPAVLYRQILYLGNKLGDILIGTSLYISWRYIGHSYVD